MIAGINASKTFTKYISCVCKCKFDGRKCNSNQKWNNNKCRCKCKNIIYVKKITFGILLHVVANNGKYLASIIDDSVIMRDEIIDVEAKSFDEETKTNFTTNFTTGFITNFNEKKSNL